MKHYYWLGVLLAASVAVLFCMAQTAGAQDAPPATEVEGNIEWVFDYEEGKKLSEETGRPMFVVFRCER